MTFRIRPEQQDHLSRNLVGTDLAKSLGRLSKDAFFNADTGQVCIVGARDQRSYLALDAKGRVVKMTTPLGRVTQLAFKDGRLVRTMQPTGLTTDIEYSDGDLTRRFQRSDGARGEMRFDARGNLTALTNPDGGRLRMQYDSEGRVTDIDERDGTKIHREYDDIGRLTRVVDPLGRVTRLQYGGWNLPERIVYPNRTVESYEYTTASSKQFVGDEEIAEFTTDDKGRLTAADYVGGRKLAFQYDYQGKVVAATSEDAEAKAKYDKKGRVVADDQDGRVVEYAYDDDGHLATLTLPTGEVLSYTYDLDGRLLAVRDWNGGVQQFGYGAGQAPVTRWLPNGLVERTGYDHAGNVSAIQVDTPQGTLWYQSYQRDVVDRIVERTDSRHGDRQYAYSQRGQLVAVTKGSTGQSYERYNYDAAGCRVQSQSGATSYDSLNRPVHDGSRVNKSPTLRQNWADLTSNPDPKDNWTMEQGQPGAGSQCDSDNKTITLDPNLSSNPDNGAATVAHEIGHATSPGAQAPDVTTATDRGSYVDDATNKSLTEEGRATLKNAQARQEISDNGGPDIGYAGDPANNAHYDSIVQQVNNGNLTPEQGAQQIGQTYGNGETVSGTDPPQTYGDNLRDWYGNNYDKYHP